MHDNYSKTRGLYTNHFGENGEAFKSVGVSANESRILEGRVDAIDRKERRAVMQVCECGRDDAFKIFGRGITTVAKCSACDNEKVIHEG